MTRRTRLVLCLTVVLTGVAIGDDEQPKARPDDRFVAYYKEVAKGYDVRLRSTPEVSATVIPEPVLVYANPSGSNDSHGAFFIWTQDGRPQVIASIWSWRSGGDAANLRSVNHEFQSLATEPLEAKGKEGVRWAPSTPGIELKPVPDAPAPAASRNLRLAQMRAIMRQFGGFDVKQRSGPNGEDAERMLRALPTPLYRYAEDKNKPSGIDGAIFGFFFDWDPEIMLVLETRPTKDGPRWHYGVGRIDNKPLRLEYNGTEVWSKPGHDFGSPTSSFYCKFDASQISKEIK